MNKRPVIIDCDPGHDDAIAILLALAAPSLDVCAITTVAGNQTIDNVTRNALKILELCGRPDIPVGSGRSNPLMQKVAVGLAHGASGMDGPVLPNPKASPSPLSAVELIAHTVESSNQKVTLIVTGPFTNIAVFLTAYPHLKDRIELISAMGGGVYQGNRGILGEFNIWNDPEAAKILFDSGIPVNLYGLDVTHKAIIKTTEFNLFRRRPDKISQFVADLLDFFSAGYMRSYKFADCPMHDSCAVAALIDPTLFTAHDAVLTLDVEGKLTRGAVSADMRVLPEIIPNGSVALDVDRSRFLQLILDSCSRLSAKTTLATH